MGTRGHICTSVRYFCVSTSIASHFLTVIPVAPHHCGLLLYWTGCLWMSAMLHAVVPFFVVFSLCLKPLLPWLWLLLLWWLLCAPVWHLFFQALPWAPPWWGFQWHQVSMMWLCHCHGHKGTLEVLLALPLCHSSNLHVNASSGLYQLCHGFSAGRFLFQSWASHHLYFYMFGVCSGVCFLLSGAMLDAYSPLGAQLIGFAPLQSFGVYLRQAYVQPGDGHWPTPGMHRVAVPSTALGKGTLLLLSQLSSSHSNYMVGHTALGTWQRVTQSLYLPCMVGSGLLFHVRFHLMTQLTQNLWFTIKPGDSGMVIGYQVDEFTCTWSAEQIIAHSHIHAGFTSKVSSLIHFPLEPGDKDYSFLDQAVADFKWAWIPSSLILLRHQNWTHSWMSLMPLHLQSLLGFSTQYYIW